MRGAGDELSVGERVAFYRIRRGLTQRQLAALVGRSEEWVSSIERGRRPVRRLDVLTRLATALRVELPDLLGQPVLMEDDEGNDDIPAVRDALMAPRRLSRLLYGPATPSGREAPDPARAGRYVEQVWFEYQAGRVGRVVAALPALIATAHQLEDAAGDNRLGWAVSARVHHLASTTLSKVGESDLAWIAAEKAMYAAEQADDPLVVASAARAGTHAFLATGRYSDAMDLGTTAAAWLRAQMDGDAPEALSLFGMLQLRTAMAASRNHDRAAATEQQPSCSTRRGGLPSSSARTPTTGKQASARPTSRCTAWPRPWNSGTSRIWSGRVRYCTLCSAADWDPPVGRPRDLDQTG
jgi:transcriptional regulator with XRE-family HTH domain